MLKNNSQLNNNLRDNLVMNAKTFKTSWIFLGQTLYTVYRDKLFHEWGYEKFEDYVTKELGMKKNLALKLVKTYFFVEQNEPGYLKEEFAEGREVAVIPSYEPLDILRLAKKSDISREDYNKIRNDVFEKAKDPTQIKRDLTAMIKARKEVDPDQERADRNHASLKKFMAALKSFYRDMKELKLIEDDVIRDSEHLLDKLTRRYE